MTGKQIQEQLTVAVRELRLAERLRSVTRDRDDLDGTVELQRARERVQAVLAELEARAT